MRIRTKIALLYTQLTFIVLLVAFSIVYGITAKNTFKSYYEELWERARVIKEVEYSEYDSNDRRYRYLLENSYQYVLNEEKVNWFDADAPSTIDSLRKYIPREKYIDEILGGNLIEFEADGKQHMGVYFPGDVNRIILISGRNNLGHMRMNELLNLFVIILLSSTLFVFFAGQLYARRIMAPVRRIIDDVKSITANNLKKSLREEHGNDELSELSRTFNQMIERLRTSFDMQNSFIRNASHELRNPLAAILGETELALNRPRSQQEYVETLYTVLEETERLNYMMQDLLMLAQTDFDFSRIRKEEIDLVRLCAGINEEIRKSYPNANVEIAPAENVSYVVVGAPSILRLALLNLIGNAVKFSDGKSVVVRLEDTQYGYLCIEIIDQGIGIPADELNHIRQPFYRGANTSGYKGTGIGLALAQRIIELHEGQLIIKSEVGRGTKVIVRLNKQL